MLYNLKRRFHVSTKKQGALTDLFINFDLLNLVRTPLYYYYYLVATCSIVYTYFIFDHEEICMYFK
jgi:hypothetical protein